MITLYILTVVAFWAYVGYIMAKYGVLPSLSDSYYHLPLKKRDIIFTSVFYYTAIAVIILAESGLMFAAGVGICAVGTAPQFERSYAKPIHYIGAAFAALFSQLYIIFIAELWPLTGILVLIGLILYLLKVNNIIWWIEMVCFLTAFIALGIMIL